MQTLQIFLVSLLLIPLSLLGIADVALKKEQKLQEMLLIKCCSQKSSLFPNDVPRLTSVTVAALQVGTCGDSHGPGRGIGLDQLLGH